jgi:hypothetical protein
VSCGRRSGSDCCAAGCGEAGCCEGCGEAVVSGCDAPEVFQPAEDALDGVATAVERGAEAALAAPVCLRRMCPPDTFGSSSGHLRFSAPRRVLRSRLRSDPHRRRDQRSPGRPRGTASIGVSPPRRSAVLPPERWNAIGLPAWFAAAWILLVRPPRGGPIAACAMGPPDGLRVLPPLFRPRRCGGRSRRSHPATPQRAGHQRPQAPRRGAARRL